MIDGDGCRKIEAARADAIKAADALSAEIDAVRLARPIVAEAVRRAMDDLPPEAAKNLAARVGAHLDALVGRMSAEQARLTGRAEALAFALDAGQATIEEEESP